MDAVQLTFVKGELPGPDRDRVYLADGHGTHRVAVHVAHDLPHLAVESYFGLNDGLWGELAAGVHREADRAATARDRKRQKDGRIVSGAASGATTDEWLTPGHRVAKTITNAVANRWADGPDTPAGVRARLSREQDEAITTILGRVDDSTIAAAIAAVHDLDARWIATPPGSVLRLEWPLEPS